MDKNLLKRYLGEAEDQVDKARIQIARQETLVRVMKREERDVTIAVALMTQFENVLKTLENLRDFILRQLGDELLYGAEDD